MLSKDLRTFFTLLLFQWMYFILHTDKITTSRMSGVGCFPSLCIEAFPPPCITCISLCESK